MAKKPSRQDDEYQPDDAQEPDALSQEVAPADPPPQAEPTQAEKDADKKPIDPEEAERLMRAGHRLRIKGEPPANWISMTRHSGDLAISYAATDDNIKEALAHDLLLVDG